MRKIQQFDAENIFDSCFAQDVFGWPTKDVLSKATVKNIFGIELLDFSHPQNGYSVSALDIPITKTTHLKLR